MPKHAEMESLRTQVIDLHKQNHILLLQMKDLHVRLPPPPQATELIGGQVREIPPDMSLLESGHVFNLEEEERKLPYVIDYDRTWLKLYRKTFVQARALYGSLLYTLQHNPGYLAQVIAACTPEQQQHLLPIVSQTLLNQYSINERWVLDDQVLFAHDSVAYC